MFAELQGYEEEYAMSSAVDRHTITPLRVADDIGFASKSFYNGDIFVFQRSFKTLTTEVIYIHTQPFLWSRWKRRREAKMNMNMNMKMNMNMNMKMKMNMNMNMNMKGEKEKGKRTKNEIPTEIVL